MTTLIHGGTVVDGTGRAAFAGDVLVADDRIADVIPAGAVEAPPAADRRIDATDCLVTPGFIDAHAHSDAYLVLEPLAPSKLAQGVTTEINGQCGGSVAPRYGEARLSSDWAALLGERLTWRSLAEYRAVLDAARPAINTLRSSVVGYAPRPSTPDEVRKMRELLAQALDEGGWGLTTGLVYQPGCHSTPDETVALARTAAERGGLYATHMRSEGDAIEEAIDEVLALVDATGIRAEISHLKTSGRRNWPKIDRVLDRLQKAVDAGRLLGSDRYPFCAAGTDLDIVLPDWAQAGAAPAEMQRLADAATRARLVAEIDAADRDWTTVTVGGTWAAENAGLSGRTVAEILAARPGLTPGALVCDILERDGCKTGAFFFGMCEENLAKIYERDWVVPGSDASLRAPWGPLGKDHPHPRAYGTMPEFYRRVKAISSREAAIRRMTAVPAERFGLRGRGTLVRGAAADVVVWKEDEFVSRATYEKPHCFAGGVRAVLVNGTLPYLDGAFTDARGGRFLEPRGQ